MSGVQRFEELIAWKKGEVRSQTYVASDVGHISPDDCDALIAQCEEVSRLTGALRRSIDDQLKTRAQSSDARSAAFTQDSALSTQD